MKKQSILCVALVFVLFVAVVISGLIRRRSLGFEMIDESVGETAEQFQSTPVVKDESAPETAALEQDTLMSFVIHGLGREYIYEISNEGDLSTAMGTRRPLRVETRSVDDFENPTTFDIVRLPEKDLKHLIELADQAAETYELYKDREVHDCDTITLWYRGVAYYGFFADSFPDLSALADALIELSPIPYEISGYS